MANVVELIEQQVKKSREFPSDHFGLKVGQDWPDFVKKVLTSKDVKTEVTLNFIMTMFAGPSISKKIEASSKEDTGVLERMAEDPLLYETPLKFLYWGMQVGKQLAEVERD
jgi:hypothetical protein